MSDPVNRRPYRSPRRREQAAQTRERVLDAAVALFLDRGYEGASVAAIAGRAGVSPETVYARFASKRGLLGEAVRRAVRGDDPRPVPEQQTPRSLAGIGDTRKVLRTFADDVAARLERAAPLAMVAAAAARSEPELAELLACIHADRRFNLRVLVDALASAGCLRVEPDAALDTVWALTSPELHQLLAASGGFSRARYATWLADVLAGALLPPAAET